MTYTIHAGNNSTDLGQIGTAQTLTEAHHIGRDAVQTMLPNAEGSYTIRDKHGRDVAKCERSIRTGFAWANF